MLDYINNNLPGFWVALGFALLAAEALVFGFTTIILLFAGLGALVTGGLMAAGVIPETWLAGVAGFGISTGICSAILWRPLKKMQDSSTPQKKQNNDLVGLEFVLNEDISTVMPGRHRYSGVDWSVEIDRSSEVDRLSKGDRVVVVAADVGVFRVKKAVLS